ncbi:MAG: thiamine biosynthesis protein ThiS [Gammaproteobacteria bacterium]|jgi:thiamine biosynthesis protein ThiS|nr:thiamine biosynthesis protein ThiS [Gammaproteobacteria bacterium]|tara:strand:+ start:171 stop:380 length:210 start_codon:yes stop_codon:yes gene_type:complete
MDKIEFILNDKEELIEQNSSLLLLIKRKKIQERNIAIEVNQKIIPKSEWNDFKIKQNDIIEVVTAIGGG